MRMFLILALFLGLASGSHAASLIATHDSAVQQNIIADEQNLSRLSEVQLTSFKANGRLVQLRNTDIIRVDHRIPARFQWTLPTTEAFIVELADAYYKRFGRRLQINSAVRTVEYQRGLRRRNGNAAATSGPKASTHLTGATIDIAKLHLPSDHVDWLRLELLVYEALGRVDATEEFAQAVFHIMVYPTPIQVQPTFPVLTASNRAD